MSNKNLLNESTIRKFMKLASIEPLASDFINKIQEAEEEVEEGMRMKKDDDEMREGADKEEVDEGKHEDEVDEGMRFKADDDDVDEGMRFKADDKDEMREGEHDDELDEDVDLEERGMMFKDDDDLGGADKMLNMNDFLDILEKAVEEFLGEPTDIERDEEPADDMEMDMEMDAEEGDMEMDMELDAEEGDEDPLEEEDLAEAIYKQVLKRLSK